MLSTYSSPRHWEFLWQKELTRCPWLLPSAAPQTIVDLREPMFTLNPEQWKLLSPYLGQALALSETERSGWLGTLRAENPAMAEQLRALLDEQRAAEQEGFLEGVAAPRARGSHQRSRQFPACRRCADGKAIYGKRAARARSIS
jgi:hypothetical protein